ncbi:MAG: hypothetical protein KA714_30695 [Limnoraphis sp. WC205]|jgi:hypothetical protein|nr:hypothetical protein [Limnoraphis sp. WC205]
MKEYRCTRNALYQDEGSGQHNITARQGHYIKAESEEEAWEIMATRYPQETEAGFTVQEWEGFNVIIVEIKQDEQGNKIEVRRDKHGNIIE